MKKFSCDGSRGLLAWIAFIGCGLALAVAAQARPKVISQMRDDDITKAVGNALRYDYALPANDFRVVTKGGDVTLSGLVADLLARDRAERVANTVLGVRNVRNEIKVIPVLHSDSQIAADVRSALRIDPALGLQHIGVNVTKGTVLLSGTIASFVEEEAARQLAESVPGVSGVKERLTILINDDRPDSAIAADIRELIRTNVAFRETALSPGVRKGRVTISGVVASVAQKNALQRDVWVPGVKSVDLSGIRVDPSAAAPGAPPKLTHFS